MARLLALVLALCVTGCFRAHELTGVDAGPEAARPDAAPVDAGRDALARDATSPDASAPDAGSCETPGVGNPIRACVLTATGAIPSGEPYALPLSFSRCECPATRSCSAFVEGDHITLTTAICDDPVECGECEFDVGCGLPPLPVGHYFVDVNGVRTMEVDASPRIIPPVARPLCAPIPDAPDSALVCELGARPAPARPLSVCFPGLEDVGRNVRFDVVVPCPSCFDVDGGCEAQLDGARVILAPHYHRCDCPTCGACDPSCTPMTITCVSPPLPSGVYDVVVEAEDGEHPAGPIEIHDVFDPGDRVCTVL